MKTLLVLIVLILSINYINTEVSVHGNVKNKLQKVLNFVEQKYDEFHFDGLLGITLAHAFLTKCLDLPTQYYVKTEINDLIQQCKSIHNKIYPLLPNNPKYMITFRNSLLDAKKWSNILPDQFSYDKIKHLGYYKNWTGETIIENKSARYKGVKSDVCLREILELSRPKQQCYVSSICEEMMLDENRIDSGYLLTHRLLYMQIINLYGCLLPKKYLNPLKYIKIYCSYIYKEATTSERLYFPHYDIFLEQVVLCGMEGLAEFFKAKWLNALMQWQNPHGCYESVKQNITRRTSFQVDFGCSDHTTGLGAAALALHLRYILYDRSMHPYYKN